MLGTAAEWRLPSPTGGTVEHICHDWSVALDLFAGEALERAASFELDDDPDPATLEVSVQRAGGDWEPLDEGLWDLVPPRTLVLSNEAALAVGDRVRVEYGPLP